MRRPLLVFDGECGFCRRWIHYWKALTGDRVDYAPFQEVGRSFPSIPRERFEASVQLIEPDGTVLQGAKAVFRALETRPGLRWLQWLYRKMPGFAPVAETVYRTVARHRVAFSRLSSWLWGEKIEPARYGLVRWLYLKALGGIYLIALGSFWIQAQGLIGPEGILPSGLSAREIHLLCAGGMASALLLVLGLVPAATATGAWACYWFVVKNGQEFLGFQWDVLLLEMGFFSIFLTLGRREPIRPVVWLLRWLLFRLMFHSGSVKLASGDPAWRDLTALKYHFETQPLPTWPGWWMHQLPLWGLKASAAALFAIELAVPFLYFLPRKPRFLAFVLTASLQLLIDATGNYGFFGLQALALSILLLDDQFVREHLGWLARLKGEDRAVEVPGWRRRVEAALAAPAILLVFLTTVRPVEAVARLAGPLRVIHSYGVFAVMTRERNEIVFEGSRDGKTWLAYELKWKPGDPARRPGFVEPHMPRLDWQLWFAALGSPRYNAWVVNLVERLLRGAPQVLGLFARDPFPDAPPRFVRAAYYRYRFTDLATRRATGRWWDREYLGLYLPALDLRAF